jgi:hypothetical protein
LGVTSAAVSLEVSCAYCATKRVPVATTSPGEQPVVIVIVTRFRALARALPDERDFAALPYTRPANVIALAPFIVPAPPVFGTSGDVSDRGLERGYGLLLDQGASTYDLVNGDSVLADFPDRSLHRVDMEPASAAYRYGNYAGGGSFFLDERGDGQGQISLDSGSGSSFGGYARAGAFAPAASLSRDDGAGVERRRAGLDYDGNFLGGVLRVGAVAADQHAFTSTPLDPERDVNILHAEYATASRRYRTFLDATASNARIDDALVSATGPADSSSITAGFRLEHPGPVTTAFGLRTERYTGGYFVALDASTLSARFADDLAYVQASGGDARASFDAGASVSRIFLDQYHYTDHDSATATVFLPSVTGRLTLAGPLGLTASASRSLRIPTLLELASVDDRLAAQPLELGSLFDAGLSFDDTKRVKAAATLFRQDLSGFQDRRLTGVGVSVTWQVTPLVSLRGWTLHNASLPLTPPLPYAPYAPNAISRGVVWSTYDNGAFRADAIVHRDAVDGPPETDLDGDVVVRLSPAIAATAGTARIAGRRTSYVGLRLPLGGR